MSTRIHFVVTGDAEYIALGSALEQLFPDVKFTVQKVNGLTSSRLPTPTESTTKAVELVSAMLAAIDIGRARTPADYAVALDDLELENADQPQVVLQHVRLAVERCINQPPEVEVVARGSRRRFRHLANPQARRAALSERCSFHLAAPMLEAWFYGELAALRRAGVSEATKVVFDKHTCDIEKFVTSDEVFLNPMSTLYWAHRTPEKRSKHPKDYIKYLRDPLGIARGRRRYRENRDAVAALECLDWAQITTPGQYARMVAALLDDLSAMVGLPLSFTPGVLHPLVARRTNGCLRNIAG